MSLFNIIKITGDDHVIRVIDYKEFMCELNAHKYMFSTFLGEVIKDAKGSFYKVYDEDGHTLNRSTLIHMLNDYLSFTGASTKESAAAVEYKFRTTPVPYTGKNYTKSERYTMRSHEVERFGYLQQVERSDRHNNSWKETSKARKAWAKHMPVNGRQAQALFKKNQIEEDFELWDAMVINDLMEFYEAETICPESFA